MIHDETTCRKTGPGESVLGFPDTHLEWTGFSRRVTKSEFIKGEGDQFEYPKTEKTFGKLHLSKVKLKLKRRSLKGTCPLYHKQKANYPTKKRASCGPDCEKGTKAPLLSVMTLAAVTGELPNVHSLTL